MEKIQRSGDMFKVTRPFLDVYHVDSYTKNEFLVIATRPQANIELKSEKEVKAHHKAAREGLFGLYKRRKTIRSGAKR